MKSEIRASLQLSFVVLSLSLISLLTLAACAAPITPSTAILSTSVPAHPTPTFPRTSSTNLRFVEFYSPL